MLRRLHATVCKHIHLVHMETNSGYSSDKATTEVDYSYFLLPEKRQ